MALEIVCKCEKCGRGFVTLPDHWPATDPFPPANVHYAGKDLPATGICGGDLLKVEPAANGEDASNV